MEVDMLRTKSKALATAAQIAAAQPGVYSVAGATGLFVKKTPNGGSWFYRYRVGAVVGKGGKRVAKKRSMGLGSLADVGLAEARRKAKVCAGQRASRIDPLAEQERKRIAAELAARQEAKKITFAEATDNYVEQHAKNWKGRYARQAWLASVVKHAYPILGSMLLDDIVFEHIEAVLDAAPVGMARRVRQRIEAILNYATKRGQRDAAVRNPADRKMHETRRRGPVEHFRRVELEGAGDVFQQLQRFAVDDQAIAAWVFMIASAARPAEAFNARWGEIDMERGLWSVPASRMKGAEPHVVPLSAVALDVLRLQAARRMSDAVFPGRGGSPLSHATIAKAPAKAGLDAATPHGWRSVFADWARKIGRIDRDLRETALAHKLPPVEGAHARDTLIEPRRPVMAAYAQWLLGEVANVVAFPTRA
jgi:integrase